MSYSLREAGLYDFGLAPQTNTGKAHPLTQNV